MQRTVVIQEQRALMRAGLAVLIAGDNNVRVAGAVGSGPELIDLAAEARPDVAVLELRPSGWDVGEIVRKVRELCPDAMFVGLHPRREADQRALADEAGIDRLVSYNVDFRALQSAVHGKEPPSGPPTDRRLTSHGLSRREQQVVAHVAAGLTTIESAAALGLRPKTVEHHKQRLFAKLGVQNQAHAVSIAHRLGVLGNGDASQ